MINKVFVLFLFVFSAFEVASDEEVLQVGVLASLSGNWSEIGKNIQQGATLASEEVNASGGILGRRLVLNVQDTDEEKSGAKVVNAYRYLKQQGIKFFVGPTGVPGIMALTPVAPTSTNSFYKTSPKFFNASGDNYVTTKAAALRAYQRGFRKIAIFGSLQPWENDQAGIFKKEFIALGGTVVAEEYPAADQSDLRMEALRLLKKEPDAIFFAIFNQVASAARALKQRGYAGGKFASIMDKSHIEASAGALDGAELYLFDPPSAEFKQRFLKRFASEPGVFADSAYDAVISLTSAVGEAKGVEFDRVISALHSTKFHGSSGKVVNYDADGLLSRDITLYRITDGELIPNIQP